MHCYVGQCLPNTSALAHSSQLTQLLTFRVSRVTKIQKHILIIMKKPRQCRLLENTFALFSSTLKALTLLATGIQRHRKELLLMLSTNHLHVKRPDQQVCSNYSHDLSSTWSFQSIPGSNWISKPNIESKAR